MLFVLFSGSVVVILTPDYDSNRQGSSPELVPICYNARSLHRAYPNLYPSRVVHGYQSSWGMQVDWWLQPRAVFGLSFSSIIYINHGTEMKSVQLPDYHDGLAVYITLPYITLHYITSFWQHFHIPCFFLYSGNRLTTRNTEEEDNQESLRKVGVRFMCLFKL